MAEEEQLNIRKFLENTKSQDFNFSPTSTDTSKAIKRIERISEDFDWSVTREGKYREIQDEVLEQGGSRLEANVVSGAAKIVDIVEERGIEIKDRAIVRTTDWDGVVKPLEEEERDEIYPGVFEAKRTYPAAANEAGEAVITARDLDYIRHKTREIMGWRQDLILAAENGNVIEHDGETFVRDIDGYKPEEVSSFMNRPLANFQQLLRRQAAKDGVKLIFGKSLSPARLTVSVEEVEKTGLRGDSFYSQNFDMETGELKDEIENAARALGFPEPKVRELESNEEYFDIPWFDESNPIVMEDGRFIYPDNSNANKILNEVLKKQAPYQEMRYELHEDRDDFVVLETDKSSNSLSPDEAIEYLEKAAYLSQMTHGTYIEMDQNSDGWIDAYVGLEEDIPVKEIAANKIGDLNYIVGDYEAPLIFHMDDKESGVMRSENAVSFVKEDYGAEEFAEAESIDYIRANAFPDFYLAVTEALNRFDELEDIEELS